MSYIFPRRVLRAQDVLDPIELTLDISPAAERLSGRLNAHNFNQNIAATVPVQTDTFYALTRYALPVAFGDTHVPVSPDLYNGFPDSTTPANAFEVQNNFEWQPILDSSGNAARVSITTGNSVLWIHAFAQYLWYGFYPELFVRGGNAQHTNDADSNPVNLQFAVRVDGNIVPETITGIDDMTYQASIPIKPLKQRDTTPATATILPGPQDARGDQICALGPACAPVRIGTAYPVQAGPHTVEIVVRRAPLMLRDSIPDYSNVNQVYVFSRQVHVVDLKSFPTDSVGGSEVSAPAWDEEELITTTEIYTNRVQRIVTRSNAIQEGNLARGALMHYHIPATLLGSYTAEVVLASPEPGEQFNNIYPGFSSNTVTATRYSGSPSVGWALISDGVTSVTVPNVVTTTTDARILVLANVSVKDINGGRISYDYVRLTDPEDLTSGVPIRGTANYIGGFAAFRIMWRYTGAVLWESVTESTGMVNSFVNWIDQNLDQADALEFAEAQLMAEIQVTNAMTFVGSIEIGVFGACLIPANITSSGAVEPDVVGAGTYVPTVFTVRRGSVVALTLRD